MLDNAKIFPAFAVVPASPLPLPAHAHVPGTGSEPDMPPLEAAKALAPSTTEANSWPDNAAYIYGVRLLRAGLNWEAHEVWEAVWLNCRPNSRERQLLRALIQTANARLKFAMARPGAAARLIAEASGDLDELRARDDEVIMGVDIRKLQAELDALRNNLGS